MCPAATHAGSQLKCSWLDCSWPELRTISEDLEPPVIPHKGHLRSWRGQQQDNGLLLFLQQAPPSQLHVPVSREPRAGLATSHDRFPVSPQETQISFKPLFLLPCFSTLGPLAGFCPLQARSEPGSHLPSVVASWGVWVRAVAFSLGRKESQRWHGLNLPAEVRKQVL